MTLDWDNVDYTPGNFGSNNDIPGMKFAELIVSLSSNLDELSESISRGIGDRTGAIPHLEKSESREINTWEKMKSVPIDLAARARKISEAQKISKLQRSVAKVTGRDLEPVYDKVKHRDLELMYDEYCAWRNELRLMKWLPPKTAEGFKAQRIHWHFRYALGLEAHVPGRQLSAKSS